MDIRKDKLKAVYDFIDMCTDEYIIGLGNKGLLKRANKEIDKGIEMNFLQGADNISCENNEGIVIHIGKSPQECSCSCPSKNICKHIIEAILLLRKECGEKKEEAPSQEGFKWIENLKEDELLKHIDRIHMEDMIFRMEYKKAYRVEIGDSIKCLIGGKSIVIPSSGGIEKVLCSCGSDEICAHKAEGMLFYLMEKGCINREEFKNKLFKATIESLHIEESEGLKLSKELVYRISRIGLARIPESILNEIEVCAIKCSKDNIPNVEKLLRAIKGDLKEYFAKKASFSREGFLRRLTKTALVIEVLIDGENPELAAELKGEKKSRYVTIGDMNFQGMGAGSWKTKSGYAGTTYYMYSIDDGGIYTYSEISEGKEVGMYSSRDPWNVGVSMENISKGSFELKECKVNRMRRISSSKETHGEFIGRSLIGELTAETFNYNLWSELREKMDGKFDFTIKNENNMDKMVVLEPCKYGEVEFNKIHQKLIVPLEDNRGDEIFMAVQYSKEDAVLIQALESAHERGAFGKKVFGRVYKSQGELFIYPISFYYEDGRIVNLNLDGRKKGTRRV